MTTTTTPHKPNANLYMAFLLIIAAGVTALVGEPGVNNAKIAGAVLALIAFIPVFILLIKTVKTGGATQVLGVFVGGFLFKLVVILVALWYGLTRVEWPTLDFTVSCMSFMLALQFYEAVYFFRHRDALAETDNSTSNNNS